MTCEYFAPKNVGSCRDEDEGICQWKGNYVTPEEKKRRYFVNLHLRRVQMEQEATR